MNSYFFNRRIFLSLTFFMLGVFFSYWTFKPASSPNFLSNGINIIEKDNSFFVIFTNNLIVGLLLSLGGYLSGGLLSIIILFWNGFFLSEITQTSIALAIEMDTVLYSLIYHAPLEIYSFLLFASIGIRGLYIVKDIFLNKNMEALSFPKISEFILPTLILLISAIIESNL